MSCENGICQIIKACVTVMTLIALTGRFRVIQTALDDVCGQTRGAFDAVRPAQLAHCLIALTIIDQILDIDLHCWTPVMGWDTECRQCTTSSNATTPESNMSDPLYAYFGSRVNMPLLRVL